MKLATEISVALVVLVPLSFTGCSGSGRVEQGEVTLVVTNGFGQARYVDWSFSGQEIISCEFREGGAWQPCLFAPPYCKDLCTDENQLVDCCSYCVTSAKIMVVEPGMSIQVVWDGKLYTEDDSHCSECSCWWGGKPKAGEYRAEVCVYDSYTCELEPCSGPDAEGVIRDATTSGSSSCHSVEFSVEYQEDTLTLPVQ